MALVVFYAYVKFELYIVFKICKFAVSFFLIAFVYLGKKS
ncbi:hypothetical protein IEQ_02055 [Bacillus cereus BAG6X1-2]|nr:hypothetical protein IEQ_02055 [Bacillus cereus BAG6X1-2]